MFGAAAWILIATIMSQRNPTSHLHLSFSFQKITSILIVGLVRLIDYFTIIARTYPRTFLPKQLLGPRELW